MGHVARVGYRREAYRDLVRKPECKRPLGKLRRRWENNIKIGLQDVGWKGTDWIALTEDRDRWRLLGNALMNFRFP
jgi:hypothetical protein